MTYNEVKEIITNRCSHRKFTEEPVPRDTIEKLVDAARLAPSGHNLQPWRFVAVTNRDVIGSMTDAVEAALREVLPGLPDETVKKLEDYRFFMTHFKTAPAVIAVFVTESTYLTTRISREHGVPRKPGDMIDISLLGVGAAIQNLLLSAHSLGLGACWMTAPVTFAQKEIEALLQPEEGFRLISIVPVGYPTKERRGPAKKGLDEILSIVE